jgi:hypothetical protein
VHGSCGHALADLVGRGGGVIGWTLPAVSMQDVHRDQLSVLLLSDQTTVYWGIISISSRISRFLSRVYLFLGEIFLTSWRCIRCLSKSQIVGVGVAGLAIANELETAGMSDTLPDARRDTAPR